MNKLVNDIVYDIINKYPNKYDLSKARVNKLVYLTDWKSCLEYGRQVTDIEWVFNHYGPYVNEIEYSLAEEPDRFTFSKMETVFGNKKTIIDISSSCKEASQINSEASAIVDFIIEITKDMLWTDFIHTVYSTHPIKVSERGSKLNLVKLAAEYKNIK